LTVFIILLCLSKQILIFKKFAYGSFIHNYFEFQSRGAEAVSKRTGNGFQPQTGSDPHTDHAIRHAIDLSC
jgi:hypothetical protein